jgi:glycosyltransferase involved in cell wall biosynthesis
MKLLLYTHAWAPTIGGTQTVTRHLAEGLANSPPDATGSGERIEVTLVTPTPRGDMDDAKLPYRVVRSPNLLKLISLVHQSDLVHLAGPTLGPLFISWLLRKPVVIEHHGYDSVCPNGLLFYEPTETPCPGHFMARQYSKCIRCNTGKLGLLGSLRALALTFPRRWLSRTAARNIAVSGHVRNRIQLPRSEVVYHGVPSSPAAHVMSGDPVSSMRFAYVGRLVSIKGLDSIIEAAEILREQNARFHVDFVGDGPERDHLEQLTSERGLTEMISFLGFLQAEDLEKAVNEAAVVLMPSIWEETAGLAAMEHMARGKPTIVADIGGLAEIVADSGLKFPPGDSRALAGRMAKFLNDPALVLQLGAAARKRTDQLFSESGMIRGHDQIYQKIAGGSPPSPK